MDTLENELDLEVYLQNDVTAAVCGESLFGVAKPVSDYVFFYLGDSMSGRLIINHQIYSGNRGRGYGIGLKDTPFPFLPTAPRTKTILLAPGNARTRASRQAYAVWRRDLCRTITESPYGLGCFITVTRSSSPLMHQSLYAMNSSRNRPRRCPASRSCSAWIRPHQRRWEQ